MTQPIPVVCDRCRAQGETGKDPFEAFGALLDFDPVPRRTARADGWDAEVQRAFVAALSLTGSARQAARAVGKAAFGADQLLRAEGNEGFRAAYDEAMAIAGSERSRRLAEGLRTVAAEQSGWRPPEPPWARTAARVAATPLPTQSEEERNAQVWELLVKLYHKFALKVFKEREARLNGEIVAADFYLRQITFLEVCFDLLSGGGWRLLHEFRTGEHGLIDVAETTLSRTLDKIRRAQWEAMGEPPRPEHPPRDRLVEHDGFWAEPGEFYQGGLGVSQQQWAADRKADHEAAARAQVEWEAEARRDYERRRDSDAAS
ncbi:MAG TPA: hypothetical protein VF727_11030 [Allosphingosinicella sp.]|jgi:hypothetical protein